MKRPVYAALAIFAIAAMFLSAYTLRRYLPYTGIDLAPKRPPAVVLSMKDTYFVGLGQEGKQWSAKAKNVEIRQNRSITYLTGIDEGKVFDKGKVNLELKAGSAVYDTFTRDLQLAGGVEIRGTKGQKITGPGAIWNSSTQTLRSTGQVKFEMKDSEMLTDRLEMNLRQKGVRMWHTRMSVAVKDLSDVLHDGGRDAR